MSRVRWEAVLGVAVVLISLSAYLPLSSAQGTSGGVVPPSALAPAPTAGTAPALRGSVSVTPSIQQLKGWNGVTFNSSTCACYTPDSAVASGNGYVVEVARSEIEIWSSVSGALLHNQSLGSFFHTPATTSTESPRVAYDAKDSRWFVATVVANASGTGYLLVNSSKTPNPLSGWYQAKILPGAVLPDHLSLGMSSTLLVLTDNAMASGTFKEADAWILNKSALLDGTFKGIDVSKYSTTTNMSLEPALELGDNSTAYFVSDCAAATSGICPSGTAFDYFTVSGVPPGTVTVTPHLLTTSGTTCLPYSKGCTASGGAPQPGTNPPLISTGDTRILSASWVGGQLWTVGNDACKLNATMVSCLRLIEIGTNHNALLKTLVYGVGAGSLYLYDPALTVDTAFDVLLTLTKSGNTTYPSMVETALPQGGKMAGLVTVAAGTATYSPTPEVSTGACNATIPCPWGTYAGAVSEPGNSSLQWFSGYYCPSNCSSNYWYSWVSKARPDIPYTYLVKFAEVGLPKGSPWTVIYRGTSLYSTSSSITFVERNGTANFSVATVSGGVGVRYLPSPAIAPVNVSGGNVSVNVTFTKQYLFSPVISPAGAGTVTPVISWHDANTTFNLTATGKAGHAFFDWIGTGLGSYSGTTNPVRVTILSPLTETAYFQPAYAVDFTETGLPSHTNWTVSLNGAVILANTSTVSFAAPNGTYTFSVASTIPIGNWSRYVTQNTSGSFTVSGTAVTFVVPFTEEFLLTMLSSPSGSGSLSPASGWYPLGTSLNLTAGAVPGNRFLHWNGTGYGSYNGVSNPVSLSLTGSINETAVFTSLSYVAGTVTPATASVTIDGTSVSVSSTGVFNMSLGAGRHQIVATLAGYQTLHLNVSTLSGSGASVDLVLLPAASSSSGGSDVLPGVTATGLVILVVVAVVLLVVGFVLGRRGQGKKGGGNPSPPPDPRPAPPVPPGYGPYPGGAAPPPQTGPGR